MPVVMPPLWIGARHRTRTAVQAFLVVYFPISSAASGKHNGGMTCILIMWRPPKIWVPRAIALAGLQGRVAPAALRPEQTAFKLAMHASRANRQAPRKSTQAPRRSTTSPAKEHASPAKEHSSSAKEHSTSAKEHASPAKEHVTPFRCAAGAQPYLPTPIPYPPPPIPSPRLHFSPARSIVALCTFLICTLPRPFRASASPQSS